MGRKRYSPEQIITMLREAEMLLTQGTPVAEVCRKLGVTEQTYCRWRKEYGGMRVEEVVALASQYGRYGYRRITAFLRNEGWRVNHKRVERIWRREGLKVPQEQPKRGRLWLNDGSCTRLRPMEKNHV